MWQMTCVNYYESYELNKKLEKNINNKFSLFI